jgi:hypothetical protein
MRAGEVNFFPDSDSAVIEIIDSVVSFDITAQELTDINGQYSRTKNRWIGMPFDKKINGYGCLPHEIGENIGNLFYPSIVNQRE